MLDVAAPFDFFSQTPPDGGPFEISSEVGLIGPVDDGRKAREWALVLQAMGISYVMTREAAGWALRVAPAQYGQAINQIRSYEIENVDFPPKPHRDHPRHQPSAVLPIAFALLALFFFYMTGPVTSGSQWFSRGRADSTLLLSEPWRMLTALTLHADVQHVLGNVISGSIFGTAVSRRLGPGGALLAILLAGTAGNAINAVYHLDVGHRSIGASTAVFGAVGILAMVQMVRVREKPRQQRGGLVELLGPIIGGLALLGALGAGAKSDLWAHLFGFLAGAAIGLVIALVMRWRGREVSRIYQLGLGAVAFGLVWGAWALAML